MNAQPWQTLVNQIADTISANIDNGLYRTDEQLPSINIYSRNYCVARDTVEKAYRKLKREGYIQSVPGKGYFVLKKPGNKIRILITFNKLSIYKKAIYETIVKTIGDKGKVDLYIHHYSPAILDKIISTNLGQYDYYVVMPAFVNSNDEYEYLEVLSKIPADQLILLDKDIPTLKKRGLIYQDLISDTYKAFLSVAPIIAKYDQLVLVPPADVKQSSDISEAISRFCADNGKPHQIIPGKELQSLTRKTAFVVLSEEDLVSLIKKVRKHDYVLGKDVGIISFNETAYKELLEITVISADSAEMGQSVVKMVLNNHSGIVRNSFKTFVRGSL